MTVMRSLPDDLPSAVESAAEPLMIAWGRAQEALGAHASPSQLRVLLIIARHGSVTINGLADRMGAIPSSASRLCDRLEGSGLLARGQGEHDRREVNVALTHAGSELLAELGRRRRGDLEAILNRMPPAAQADEK